MRETVRQVAVRIAILLGAVVLGAPVYGQSPEQMRALWEALSDSERQALLEDVARRGLAAEAADGRPVLPLARELVALADAGLRRIGHAGSTSPDESGFLDPVREQLARGASPGQVIREHWEGDWGRSPRRLIDYARY